MNKPTVNASLARVVSLLVRGVAPTAAVASGLLPAPVLSAPGNLDSTFGDFGRVGPIIDFAGPAWSAALLDNNNTLIAGGDHGCYDYFCYYHPSFVASNFLSELSATGLSEPGFMPAVVNDTQIFDVALLPGGGIIAVGRSAKKPVLTLFQLTGAGALDTSFGSAGIFKLPASLTEGHQATSVVLDPDGRIVVAGPRAGPGATPGAMIVARLLANGVLDDTFGVSGIFVGPPSDFVDSAIHILRTGAGGYRVTTSDCKIVALTADGKLDLMFGTAGIAALPSPSANPVTCNAMASQADGSLLVAGSAGPEQSYAGRLLANGTADPSFSANAVETGMADATALAVGADGSIVVAGTRPGGLSGDVVMRLQANGMLDMVFGKGGSTIVDLPSEFGTVPVIHELLLRPDGAVLAAGGDYTSRHPFVVRLVGMGGADGPGVLGVSASVRALEQSQEAIVKVQRTGGAAGSVSVAYQTVSIPQSATVNQDYTPVSGRLSWSAGDASEQEIHVPIVADNVIEEQEYFTVVLSDPQGGAGLATRDARVEIQPDGSPYGQFQIGVNTPSVTEPGTAELFVSRNYYGSGAVSVTVTPKAGTATAGSDFAPAPVTVSWADGETGAKTVSIAVPDDAVQEPDETFTVELSNPTGGAIIGPESQVTVTIAASDQPPPSSGGGGGGSIGFGSLLLLGVARLLQRRRVSARPHPPVN